ncbi:MAG: trypsin-like serine protease [bacterium]|nr:trypsin-like serine protease [bacterium]
MRTRIACIALALGSLLGGAADAIVVRHDRDAVATTEEAKRFRAVCKVLPDGEGVLVAPRWVLTADHVATGASLGQLRVVFGGVEYRIEEVFSHPDARAGRHDIALMRLAQPVQRVEPLELDFDDGLVQGAVVWMAGRGDHGDGKQAVVGNDGKLRVAENAIHILENDRLAVRLDAPDDGALEAEGISGPGDSGTPILLEKDGKLRVVGIGSVGQTPKGMRYGMYGSLDFFIRVQSHREWFGEVLAADCTPSQARPGAAAGAAGIVREVAGLVQQHFLDAELRGLDWNAVRDEHIALAADVATTAERTALINGMLARLETSHTHHFTPDAPEYYQLLDLFAFAFRDWIQELMPPDGVVTYPGIGLITRERDGRHFVIGKIHGTPASRSTIAVGDEVLAVDDEPFRRVASFRGKAGRTVRVTVRRTAAGNGRSTIELTPQMLQPGRMFLDSVRASARVYRRDGAGVAYVRVWSYAGEQYQRELEQQLRTEALAGTDALVLDIRDGWGGASPRYLNLFNPNVPVLQSRARGAEWGTHDTQWRKPVVLLVNGGTRSGKEVLAHGFRTLDIGPVVGSRTAGAVTAGRLFRLSNDDLLYLAVSDILVDGVRLEGRGVEPDVVVPFEVEYSGGVDPQLDRALEVAAGLVQAAAQP